jgi:hypothetical protein
MVEETDARISLVVKNEESGNSVGELIKKGIRKPHWLRIRGGQMFLYDVFDQPGYKQAININNIDYISSGDKLSCTPRPATGLGQKLPDKIVDQIVNRADVVFRQGFGIIKGDILTRPSYGVLSYHHGDPRAYRGGPPGFWEFLHGRDTAGMMLQRLSEELDAGEIIVYDEVDISDSKTWREVQKRQYRKSEDFLAEAIRNLSDSSFEPQQMELGPVRTAPKIGNYIRYICKNNLGRLRSGSL